MRRLGFLVGVAVGWLGARLAGDRSRAAQQDAIQQVERARDVCRQSLADRTAEVERLRAEVERLQTELDALRVSPPSIPARFAALPVTEEAAPVPAPAPDDLTIMEGIGPKIAALLIANGICTFADLAAADLERLREILVAAGPRFRLANPATWPEQAQLAARGAWGELTALQGRLKAGAEL